MQDPPPQEESAESTIDFVRMQDNNEEIEEKTTARQTLIHLIKGYVGPGCLSLPWAFSQLGIVGGCTACILLSWWSSSNCWRVLRLKRYVVSSQQGHYSKHMTYPDVGEWAYGPKFRKFVLLCICVQQLAICTVFLSFIGANTVAVLQRVMDGSVNHTLVVTLCLPAVVALSCIPNLRRLAPVTFTGTVLLGIAFMLLGVVIGFNWSSRPEEDVHVGGWNVPLAMCAILYSYEGINLILPIETAMKHPQEFKNTFVIAMMVVCTIFATIASVCVLAFGRVTNGSITAFLINHETDLIGREWILWTNTAVTFSVLLTYPLQLFPVLELVSNPFKRRNEQLRIPTDEEEPETNIIDNAQEEEEEEEESPSIPDGNDSCLSNSMQEDDDEDEIESSSPWLRLSLVMLTYVVAILIPNVQVLISLAGALAGSSTALLIPPLLELEYIKRTSDTQSKALCWFLFGMGLVFCIIGTSASIADIVKLYL